MADPDADPDRGGGRPAPTVRPIPSDRRAEFQTLVDYAFSPEDGPTDYDTADPGAADLPERRGDLLGVFVGDDLRSVCAHYDLEARLRGEWAPLAGLAAVATRPEHRREGYVRRLVEESLSRWRGSYPLAALWPFDYGYYRQFGWATACKRVVYTCSPDALAFARGADRREAPGTRAGAKRHASREGERSEPPGRVRRLSADDWACLVDAHEAHAASRALTIRRDERWWRRRVFETIDGETTYVYAFEDADGAVEGYLVYDVDRPDGDRRLGVRDLAFVDESVYLRILAFLADHDSQVAEVRLRREVGTDLLDRVDDPRSVDCEVEAGPMVRVVDVADALSGLAYPDGVDERVRLAVADDTAPWNDGTFRLAVGDGATCERVDDGEADATVDVRTLAQLVVGYHSVADARRLGALEVGDPSTAEALDALFPPETVFLRTFF